MIARRTAAASVRRRVGRRSLAVIVSFLAGGALVLAGCSASTPSAVTTSSESGAKSATTIPLSYRNAVPLRRNVTLSACMKSKDGWRASGRARNPGTSTRRYVVTVYFTDDQATVVGSGRATVSVAAGTARRWTVDTVVHGPAPADCVLVGVT